MTFPSLDASRQAPTSRMLEAWPTQERQREVFERIVEKYNA